MDALSVSKGRHTHVPLFIVITTMIMIMVIINMINNVIPTPILINVEGCVNPLLSSAWLPFASSVCNTELHLLYYRCNACCYSCTNSNICCIGVTPVALKLYCIVPEKILVIHRYNTCRYICTSRMLSEEHKV